MFKGPQFITVLLSEFSLKRKLAKLLAADIYWFLILYLIHCFFLNPFRIIEIITITIIIITISLPTIIIITYML